jgi:hypothetical protein
MRIYKQVHLKAVEYSFGSKIITCICYNVKIEYNFNIIYATIYLNIKNVMKGVVDYNYVTTVT